MSPPDACNQSCDKSGSSRLESGQAETKCSVAATAKLSASPMLHREMRHPCPAFKRGWLIFVRLGSVKQPAEGKAGSGQPNDSGVKIIDFLPSRNYSRRKLTMTEEFVFPRSLPCQTCATVAETTFTCIQCNNLAFCDTCWSKWILHIPGAVGWNGKPHERADLRVVDRLRQILEPTRTEEEHKAELLEDQDTTWFGYGRDASNHPHLYDYGRFAAIVAETQTEETGERYPQLASFIGETGAGKSTIIKLLIDRQDLASPQGSKYYSPVTSSNQDRISTTGDVHLYADPSTLYATNPLLFVDCEGLSGGEAAPKQLRQAQDSGRYATPRKIEWAQTPQTQKREFAVGQLYPRILYTFSDVVIFVMRNPRSFESTVLHRLIKWGAASIDKSINQPLLPHAIIVLNATDTSVDEKEWDVPKATQMLLSDISDAIQREPVLQQYAQIWRQRGRRLNTTKELLECYYASINVVRVPYKGSYMLMNEQAGKLADLIKDRCAIAHAKKKMVRMQASTEKLHFYLMAAFDHFTRDLNTPFDFVKEMLRHSPVSRNFEGNILNLSLLIKESAVHPAVRNDAEQIFRAIGPMIASCVMLDAVRQKLPGTVSRLLDDRYAKSCVGAIQAFAEFYWPCSFENPMLGELGRCCNVKLGHNPKGHQNKQGKIIGHGEYQSSFNIATFQPEWEHLIRASLVQVQSASLRLSREFSDRLRFKFHQLFILPMLLKGTPRMRVALTSKTTIEINRCPIHVRDVIASPPWVIVTKPRFAGARTLCLDGGGIRGIIQLHVLRELEKILGPDLPVQLFFDLIVGTDFGGIIAIALGVKKWSVSSAIDKFKDLCHEAYIARGISKLPLSKAFATFYHKSIYKHQPLEGALRRYLSEQPLFGATSHRSWLATSTKVAVTARNMAGRQDVVFANYNRPDILHKRLPYHFSRSDAPIKEIRIWEAARATTATAPLFPPYKKAETGFEYANGGMQYMCPILVAHYEAKSIWKDTADLPPDLVLSIGSGRNIGDSSKIELNSPTSLRTTTNDSLSTSQHPSTVIRQGRGGMGNYKRQNPPGTVGSGCHSHKSAVSGYIVRNPQAPMLVTFNNPISGQTDRLNDHSLSEKAWGNFLSTQVSRKISIRRRYRRICPELFTKLPKFDDVSKLDDVEREAREVLRQNSAELIEIAHGLVASTFFFEKDMASIKQTVLGFKCTGSIFCRFRPYSPEIKALAWFLISLLDGDFEPYFLIEEENEDGELRPIRQIALTDSVLQDMHLQGNFQLEQIRINATHENSDIMISIFFQNAPYSTGVRALPISGFPRRLMSEDGRGVHQAVINASALDKRSPQLLFNKGLRLPCASSWGVDELETFRVVGNAQTPRVLSYLTKMTPSYNALSTESALKQFVQSTPDIKHKHERYLIKKYGVELGEFWAALAELVPDRGGDTQSDEKGDGHMPSSLPDQRPPKRKCTESDIDYNPHTRIGSSSPPQPDSQVSSNQDAFVPENNSRGSMVREEKAVQLLTCFVRYILYSIPIPTTITSYLERRCPLAGKVAIADGYEIQAEDDGGLRLRRGIPNNDGVFESFPPPQSTDYYHVIFEAKNGFDIIDGRPTISDSLLGQMTAEALQRNQRGHRPAGPRFPGSRSVLALFKDRDKDFLACKKVISATTLAIDTALASPAFIVPAHERWVKKVSNSLSAALIKLAKESSTNKRPASPSSPTSAPPHKKVTIAQQKPYAEPTEQQTYANVTALPLRGGGGPPEPPKSSSQQRERARALGPSEL
ncbi:hypothetical protein GQX73_g9958 [Xylaria multiplex]|uniref:PNPLA domain-containing protein n=1 Tax=Xylaria multiplex TaxID=323545 RepID=A0A7C8IH79_9PEZI|nr:hypothetical protein GQX73_g9958 [Xylaria multiplex]